MRNGYNRANGLLMRRATVCLVVASSLLFTACAKKDETLSTSRSDAWVLENLMSEDPVARNEASLYIGDAAHDPDDEYVVDGYRRSTFEMYRLGMSDPAVQVRMHTAAQLPGQGLSPIELEALYDKAFNDDDSRVWRLAANTFVLLSTQLPWPDGTPVLARVRNKAVLTGDALVLSALCRAGQQAAALSEALGESVGIKDC
jgi:hypothetical protein